MKLDDNKMHKAVMEVVWELNNGVEKDSLKTFLLHRLETLISVVEDCSDTDMYDLFDDETIELIENALNN